MLIGRYSVHHRGPGRFYGGSLGVVNAQSPGNFGKSGAMKNALWGGFPQTVSFPYAYRGGGAWSLAQKDGGVMGASTTAYGETNETSNLAGGYYGEAVVSGSSTTDADAIGIGMLSAAAFGSTAVAGLIRGLVQCVASILGSTETSAAMSGAFPLGADVSGVTEGMADLQGAIQTSGSASGSTAAEAIATLAAALSADVTGSTDSLALLAGALLFAAAALGGTLVAGQANGLGKVSALSTGSTTASASGFGEGNMSADVTPYTTLSPQNLAAAVWDSVASEFNASGTMGRLLNASGGGSDPETIAAAVWSALRAASADPATMGQALVELFDLMGLDATKPLVTTDTSRVAGAITQTITEDATSVTVQRT